MKKVMIFMFILTSVKIVAQPTDLFQLEMGVTYSQTELFAEVFSFEKTFLQDGKDIGIDGRLRLSYAFIEGRYSMGSYQRQNQVTEQWFQSIAHFSDLTVGFEYNPDWLIGDSDISWSVFLGYTRGIASAIHKNHLNPSGSLPLQGNYRGWKSGIRFDVNGAWYVPNLQIEYSRQKIFNDRVLDGLVQDGYDRRKTITVSLLFTFWRSP